MALDVDPGSMLALTSPPRPGSRAAFASIVPNTDLPFFEDVRVRRALYHALDRDEYIASYGAYSVKADAYLPPGHPMYSDTLSVYAMIWVPPRACWTRPDGPTPTATASATRTASSSNSTSSYPDFGNDARQGPVPYLAGATWRPSAWTLNCVPMAWSDLI